MRFVSAKRAVILSFVLAAMVPAAAFVGTAMLTPEAGAEPFVGQRIYVHNNTDKKIWVACTYIPPGQEDFVTSAFHWVDPGETYWMLSNNGRNIYFYAENDDGNVWEGNATRRVVQDSKRGTKTVNMFREDTGTGYEPWTMTFNP